MITLFNIGVSVDKGVIPPMNSKRISFKLFEATISVDMGVIPPMNSKRIAFKLFEATISLDMGVIPPKNYFQEKISNIGVSVYKAEPGILIYQIM